MFDFRNLLKNRTVRYTVFISVSLVVLYILLRLTLFSTDPVLPLLDVIYKAYLLLPEWIAMQLFEISDSAVTIKNHQLIFSDQVAYHISYERFITNWPEFFLYRRWSALIIVLIIFIRIPLRKKLISGLCFVLTHLLAVTSGLFFMGVVYPKIYVDASSVFLSPTLAGNIILYLFLAIWILTNKTEIRSSAKALKINLNPSNQKILEIIVFLFFFLVLREFLIPFFKYRPYVNLLLLITESISSLFGYSGYIEGDQLTGDFGTLGLAKHCLGFMSMYLFASLVFLTREALSKKVTLIFIISGLLVISILNIIRLTAVFIVVQGENGTERASLHHEIYNVVIYIFIFAMWIIWYEAFIKKAKKKKATK